MTKLNAEQMRTRLQAVLAQHHAVLGESLCIECRRPYPCTTVRILTERE